MISNGGQVVIMLCDDESNAWTIGGDKNGLGVHGVGEQMKAAATTVWRDNHKMFCSVAEAQQALEDFEAEAKYEAQHAERGNLAAAARHLLGAEDT